MNENRIFTTHVGSLPRPPALLTLMRDKAEGRHSDAKQLDRNLAESVAAVVRRQVEAGIDLISDGEFSKSSYATYVTERLSGFGDLESGKASESRRLQVRSRRQPCPICPALRTSARGRTGTPLPSGAT